MDERRSKTIISTITAGELGRTVILSGKLWRLAMDPRGGAERKRRGTLRWPVRFSSCLSCGDRQGRLRRSAGTKKRLGGSPQITLDKYPRIVFGVSFPGTTAGPLQKGIFQETGAQVAEVKHGNHIHRQLAMAKLAALSLFSFSASHPCLRYSPEAFGDGSIQWYRAR